MPSNRFWDREVVEAKELIEHAKGVDYAFVGVLRAKAIVEVDEELKKLRAPAAATVAAMRELLWRVLTDVDDDFDGFSSVRNDILRFFGRDPDTEPWPSVREGTDGAE